MYSPFDQIAHHIELAQALELCHKPPPALRFDAGAAGGRPYRCQDR